MSRPRARRGVGCLSFLVVYGLSLALMFVLTRQAPETSPLSERALRLFHVAVVEAGSGGAPRRVSGQSLTGLSEPPANGGARSFLLPAPRVRIADGDIHHVEVLEEHGDWQLVAYHYANTVSTVSTYKAYADHVEPVSFRLVSHVGQALYAMFLLLPAWLLSLLLTMFWRRRLARAAPAAES